MKRKSMTIVYEVHEGLYVNLTNKCPCACTFCLRQTTDTMENSDPLWLEHEPSAEEVIDSISTVDMSKYKELVFCGFGEPTERLDVLLKVASYVKSHYPIPIRINTNGMGDLIHQTSIAPSFRGLIDTVSISLNTPNAARFLELTKSKFGEGSFEALLAFAKSCVGVVPHVVMTTVDTTITKEEEAVCQSICDSIGATYRIRPWEDS